MEKRFLSFPETAAFLGLSRSKVEKLVGQRKIPSYKIDKRRVFDKEELVEWVKNHKEPGSPGKSKRSKPNESYPGPSSTPKSGQKSKRERR